jgi:O-antigen ligase/tetratricopeptide (TPR) repeat protein
MKDILRAVVLTGIFCVPFLPLVVANSLFFPFITGKNFAFRIIVEVILASWAVLAFLDASYRPRFSWILGAFMWFVAVIFAADIFGVSPHKSLWSNYERMEGFVTLIHLFGYFVVLSSTLTTEKLWRAFFATSVGVACLMSIFAFGQIAGTFQINQSATRIDARLGNAAYLAIYMLFHVYLALLLAVGSRAKNMRYTYIALAVMFVFVLFQTGTRGTALALGGSAFLTGLYIALFAKADLIVRKFAIGAVALVVVSIGAFVLLKDSEFIKSYPNLARISTISLGEAQTRFTIWALAFEGVKQRPILGWGQENFNYVFNQNYKASLYAQEPWFDRVHNIVFDWLIAGGIVGFLAYVATIFSTLYYATIRPLYQRYSETFSVPERGLILGVLAGYIAHNMFVFDNLISYTLFVAVIAFVHARIGEAIPSLMNLRVEEAIVKNIVAPTALVIGLGTLYLVNIPGIQAASALIDGFRGTTPDVQYAAFDKALTSGTFASQEVREQFTRISQGILQDPQMAVKIRQAFPTLTAADQNAKVNELREKFISRAESELESQIAETPDDVRILVFQSSFLRSTGKTTEAMEVLEKAVALSPEKQQTHFELGLALIQSGQTKEAMARFKTAYDLEPKNDQARMFYAMAALYTNDLKLRDELITPEFKSQYVTNDMILRALYDTKNYKELTALLKERIALQPGDVQLRVSLAAILREMDDIPGAILTLEQAIVDFPDFKEQGTAYIATLKSGDKPQ